MNQDSKSLALQPSASAAPVLSEAPILHVLFKVDGIDFALPARRILQMESYTGATRVPGAPPFVAGVVQLRGRMIPVVDLRVRFGMPPSVITSDSRVIVGERNGRAVALLADVARDVARIAPSQCRPPPAIVEQGAISFVESLVQLDGRPVLILDFAKVIGEEVTHVE